MIDKNRQRGSRIISLRAKGKTYAEIGKMLGVSSARVQQIESKYLRLADTDEEVAAMSLELRQTEKTHKRVFSFARRYKCKSREDVMRAYSKLLEGYEARRVLYSNVDQPQVRLWLGLSRKVEPDDL